MNFITSLICTYIILHLARYLLSHFLNIEWGIKVAPANRSELVFRASGVKRLVWKNGNLRPEHVFTSNSFFQARLSALSVHNLEIIKRVFYYFRYLSQTPRKRKVGYLTSKLKYDFWNDSWMRETITKFLELLHFTFFFFTPIYFFRLSWSHINTVQIIKFDPTFGNIG